jgi:putative DNA methylase
VIPEECKRLAEVDFPIAVVSKHSAREKSIRHGHPSTLHLWWARRLMALLPDPCDPNCPEEFKTRTRNIFPRVQGKPGAKDTDLRKELLRFIGDFSNWETPRIRRIWRLRAGWCERRMAKRSRAERGSTSHRW